MLGLDVLVNVANVVYLVSYSVRDILWLRIMTVLGALLLLPYYYLQASPLWAPIGWDVVFMAINIFWITKLLLERRPVQFTDEEKRLYEGAFRHLSERDALKLFRLGTWTAVPVGAALLTQGRHVDAVALIADGEVAVDLDGRQVDTLGEGRILGATAFLMRGTDFKAPVTVTAAETTRVVTWPTAVLEAAFARDADVEVAFEICLGAELSRFLQTARTHELHPHLT